MRFRLIGTIVMLCSIFVLQASYAQDALAPASEVNKAKDARLLREIMELLGWDRKKFGEVLGKKIGTKGWKVLGEPYSPLTIQALFSPNSNNRVLPEHIEATFELIEEYGYDRLLDIQYLLGMSDSEFFEKGLSAPELLAHKRKARLEDLRLAVNLLKERGGKRIREIRDLLWMSNEEFRHLLGKEMQGDSYTINWMNQLTGDARHNPKMREEYLRAAIKILRANGDGVLKDTARLLGMGWQDFDAQLNGRISGRIQEKMQKWEILEKRLRTAREMVYEYGPARIQSVQGRLNLSDAEMAQRLGALKKGEPYYLKTFRGFKNGWPSYRHRIDLALLRAAYQLLIEPGRDFEIGNYVRHEAYAIYRNRSRDADAYKRDRPFKCWWYGRITDIVIGDGIWFEATHFSRKEAEEPSPSKGSPIKIKVLWPKIAKRLKRIEEKDFVHPQKNIFSTQLLAPQSAVRESISDELREKLRRYWEGVEFTETKTVPGTEIKVGIWRVKRPKSVVLSTVPICKEMIEIIQRDGDVNLIVVDPGSESIGAEGLYKLLDWAIKNELPEGCPLDPWTFTSENFKDKRVLALLKEASQRSTRPFSINTWARGRNNIYLEEETMPDLVEMELPIIYTFLGKSVLPRPVAEFTGKLVLSCLLDWDIDTFYGQGEGHRLSELLQESKKRYLEVVGRERDERKKESGAAIEGAVCRMWSRLLRVARKHDEIQQFVSEGRSRGAGVGPLRTVLEQEQVAAYEGEAVKDLGARIGIVGVDEVTLRLMEVAIAHGVREIRYLRLQGDDFSPEADARLKMLCKLVKERTGVDINLKEVFNLEQLFRGFKKKYYIFTSPFIYDGRLPDRHFGRLYNETKGQSWRWIDSSKIRLKDPSLLSRSLAGRDVGVVGWGDLADEFLLRLAAFGANIHIAQRGPDRPKYLQKRVEVDKLIQAFQKDMHKKDKDKKVVVYNEDLERKSIFCKKVEVAVLLLSLNEESKGWWGEKEMRDFLSGDKEVKILVNTSRGDVIGGKDEKSIVNAAQSDPKFRAGLDVKKDETKGWEELQKVRGILVTGHMSSATEGKKLEGTRFEMQYVSYKHNIRKIIDGEEPDYGLNWEESLLIGQGKQEPNQEPKRNLLTLAQAITHLRGERTRNKVSLPPQLVGWLEEERSRKELFGLLSAAPEKFSAIRDGDKIRIITNIAGGVGSPETPRASDAELLQEAKANITKNSILGKVLQWLGPENIVLSDTLSDGRPLEAAAALEISEAGVKIFANPKVLSEVFERHNELRQIPTETKVLLKKGFYTFVLAEELSELFLLLNSHSERMQIQAAGLISGAQVLQQFIILATGEEPKRNNLQSNFSVLFNEIEPDQVMITYPIRSLVRFFYLLGQSNLESTLNGDADKFNLYFKFLRRLPEYENAIGMDGFLVYNFLREMRLMKLNPRAEEILRYFLKVRAELGRELHCADEGKLVERLNELFPRKVQPVQVRTPRRIVEIFDDYYFRAQEARRNEQLYILPNELSRGGEIETQKKRRSEIIDVFVSWLRNLSLIEETRFTERVSTEVFRLSLPEKGRFLTSATPITLISPIGRNLGLPPQQAGQSEEDEYATDPADSMPPPLPGWPQMLTDFRLSGPWLKAQAEKARRATEESL